jgi:glycosyltransferase involved in cell wall biosynthesis
VVLVDDGSDADLDGLGCTVLRHETNRGKGAALKTGLRHIRAEFPDRPVVCADPDGQHHIEDILRVARHIEDGRMVLGVRRFGDDVPWRSRFGNRLTRDLFRAATGHDLQDTQTGLRGFPPGLLSWLAGVPGEKFEYEMNVLLDAARTGVPIDEVDITTSYVDGNASSHFGAVTDSVRIYAPLLRHAVTRPVS